MARKRQTEKQAATAERTAAGNASTAGIEATARSAATPRSDATARPAATPGPETAAGPQPTARGAMTSRPQAVPRPEPTARSAPSARKRVAIACQGGGSHTAFTAGVLVKLWRSEPAWRERYALLGLSGTSGGAVCALLAWYGAIAEDWDGGAKALEAFWRDNAASEPWDAALNLWTVGLARLRDVVSMPEVSAYAYPPWPQEHLRELIERRVDFARIPALAKPTSPALIISAVDVITGEFKVWKNADVTADAVLASAAVPPLLRAVHVGTGTYWDGLFSQNPPVRDFLSGRTLDDKPDEVWLIRINPQRHAEEPTLVTEILDRRNELAGNLSLSQELAFIGKVNDWLADGSLSSARYKPVTVREIGLEDDLDLASKLDRTPSFIEGLMAQGEAAAETFLRRLP